VHHAVVRIGDSVLEMGEAHDQYPTMDAMFYLYVPNMDDVYRVFMPRKNLKLMFKALVSTMEEIPIDVEAPSERLSTGAQVPQIDIHHADL